jgi:hypothetical protein
MRLRYILLLLALSLWLAVPPGAQAQQLDLVEFAQAYDAAWNAHDLEGVLAFFAPAAVVRQPAASAGVGNGERHVTVADVYGLAVDPWNGAPTETTEMVVLAADPAQVRSWVRLLFERRHRVEATGYRASGETVSWDFRAYADPYQTVRGVGPTEGTAEAVVRAGHITTLTTASTPESVRRREAAMAAALVAGTSRSVAQATQTAAALLRQDRATEWRRETPGGADGNGAHDVMWPLALAGLGAATSLLVGFRRRAHRSTLIRGFPLLLALRPRRRSWRGSGRRA